MYKDNRFITAKTIFLTLFLLFGIASPAFALEGDWETGGMGSAVLMPARSIYGGGGEFFARYALTDGFSLSGGAAVYGVHSQKLKKSFGLYSMRVGGVYALDILQWVPSFGVHFSALFSENENYSWHRSGKGLGLDFGAQIQYRGIRHFAVGLFYRYHLVFTGCDYHTLGISVSWISGDF